MIKNLIKIISLFNLLIYVNCVIKPSTNLNIVDGEGFSIYLDLPKSFETIENCWFRFKGE